MRTALVTSWPLGTHSLAGSRYSCVESFHYHLRTQNTCPGRSFPPWGSNLALVSERGERRGEPWVRGAVCIQGGARHAGAFGTDLVVFAVFTFALAWLSLVCIDRAEVAHLLALPSRVVCQIARSGINGARRTVVTKFAGLAMTRIVKRRAEVVVPTSRARQG